MKGLRKIGKIILTIISIIVMILFDFCGMNSDLYAMSGGQMISLISKGDCGKLLKYEDEVITDEFVEYKDDENVYPAYGLNKYNKGINKDNLYEVRAHMIIRDEELWRIMINGYPYKSVKELGCKTEKEAYVATNQAIYCYIHSNKLEKYTPIGEGGKRVLSAIKKILDNASKSKEKLIIPEIKINSMEKFELDNIDKDYMSKEYELEANADFKEFKASIENVENCNYIKNIKITNLQNKEQQIFKKGEKFKVLIPVKELTNYAIIRIKVKANLESKTIIYGLASQSALKSYALVGEKYFQTLDEKEEKIEPIVKNEFNDNIEKSDKKIINTEISEKTKEDKNAIEELNKKQINNVKRLPITGM